MRSSIHHCEVEGSHPDLRLPFLQQELLIVINNDCHDGPCRLTNRKLGSSVGKHHTTVSRALRRLEEKKWIYRDTDPPVARDGFVTRKRRIYCWSGLSAKEGALQLANLVRRDGGSTNRSARDLLNHLGGTLEQQRLWFKYASQRGWIASRWGSNERFLDVTGKFPQVDLCRKALILEFPSKNTLKDRLMNLVEQQDGTLRGWTNKHIADSLADGPGGRLRAG